MFEDRGGARAFVGIRQDLVTSYDLARIYGHDSLRSQFATALSLNARSKNREKLLLLVPHGDRVFCLDCIIVTRRYNFREGQIGTSR